MTKTKIDWGIPGLLTWNPITGCKSGCSYCYARRIHERFNKTPFTEIVFHPERLGEPSGKMKPSTIFVGSMSDLEYWSTRKTEKVLWNCKQNPKHTFMFLSKDWQIYKYYKWPDNTMQGLTVTLEYYHKSDLEYMAFFPRPWLSIEPLLGTINDKLPHRFERVIVGAMTGPGAVIPRPEWIQSIKDNVPAEKIYWKPSIRPYL